MSEPKDPRAPDGAAQPLPPVPVAMALSALALTPDSALATFRAQRVSGSNLELPDLQRARDILAAVGVAISTSSPAGPRTIERLWRSLSDTEGAHTASEAGSKPAGVAPTFPEPPAATPAPAERAPAGPPAPPRSLPPKPPLLGAVAAPPAPDRASTPGRGAAAPSRPEPVAPPTPPAAAVPARPSEPKAPRPIDFAALNRFKLDEGAPETMGVDIESPLVSALPFRAAEGEAAAPEHAALPHEPDEPGLAGETITVAKKSPFPDRSLPFHKPEQPAAAAPHAAAVPEAAPAVQAAAPEREGTHEATTLGAHLATMTVEQYAALCAECAVHPAWTAQVHARYQIRSEAERAELDGRWGERMAGNEELVRVWQWHYARFEQWFRQQGR